MNQHQPTTEIPEADALIRTRNRENGRRSIALKRERNENADRDLARPKRGWRW